MSIDEIVALVAERFADVEVTVASEENGAPAMAWGDTFCTYAPAARPGDGGGPDEAPPRMPFATVVIQDYQGFDTASNLDRESVYRLNTSVGRRAFPALLGEGWAEQAVDPTALDVLIPHPVYAAQGWVSILSPSEGSRVLVEQLLSDAYERGVAQESRRA